MAAVASPLLLAVTTTACRLYHREALLTLRPAIRRFLTGPIRAIGSGGLRNYVIANNGTLYLFYQGNNDGGRTWLLSFVRLAWRDGRPVIAADPGGNRQSATPRQL